MDLGSKILSKYVTLNYIKSLKFRLKNKHLEGEPAISLPRLYKFKRTEL